MKIGCVKEIKNREYRVGLIPDNAKSYVNAGHEVWIEKGAGLGSGFTDAEYEKAGAKLCDKAKEVWDGVDMMVKVKEPLPEEYGYFRKDLLLFTYLHLAADRALTDAMLTSGMKGFAYETLIERDGSIPLLAPMSQIAGRLSIQEGAKYLEKTFGGSGVLLSGVPGTPKANMVIGSVLIPGKAAPKLMKRAYLKEMRPGSVIVDVAVDQGGCCETTKVTYHDDPIYEVDGIVHYCVGNMPGAVPRTSTIALTNATLRYGLAIAKHGLEEACRKNPVLISGVNTYDGKLTCKNVAESFEMEYTDLAELL